MIQVGVVSVQVILNLFPPQIQQELANLCLHNWSQLEEIRLRIGQPIECIFADAISYLEDIIFTSNDCKYVLNQLSEHSLYRFEDELKEGFITLHGGHRIGLAGRVLVEKGRVKRIQYITFFNIRIAKAKRGIANDIIRYLYHQDKFYHTLLIGAPQSGKTTLLRDLARIISDGEGNFTAKKVAIIDERSEIAACYNGMPQHQIGRRTDVMDACPKAEGMMMVIRSLSPEIIIVDEIGKKEDVDALLDAVYAGVTIFCSVHGDSLHEVKKRFLLTELFSYNIFQRYIVLKRTQKEQFTLSVANERGEFFHTNVVS